jgi:hypothetical protein
MKWGAHASSVLFSAACRERLPPGIPTRRIDPECVAECVRLEGGRGTLEACAPVFKREMRTARVFGLFQQHLAS